MNGFFSLLLLGLASWLLLTGCQGADAPLVSDTAVLPSPTAAQPQPEPFKVIAYVTAAVIPELIPYDQLTHINYSFLIPEADGRFTPLINSWKLNNIVSAAHEADVQVLISVGGWGWDAQFETIAADPALRAEFVRNLTTFVDEYNLDGVDMDWEYPDPGPSAENFLALIQELRQAMPPDKLLTTAVVSYGATGEGILSATFPLFDFVNIMTYEGPDHGSMEQFQTGLTYWRERGLPPEKMVMGLPFYAEPGGVLYRKLVEADPQNALSDSIEWNGAPIHYNGIPTVQTKTEMAMAQAGGIMFWTLEHDTLDELSLLTAIHQTVQQK